MSLEDRVKALEDRVKALEDRLAASDTKTGVRPASRPGLGKSPATPKDVTRPGPTPRATPGTSKYMSPAPKTPAVRTGTTPKAGAGASARVGAKLQTPSRGGAKPHTASELYNVFAHSIPVGWKPAASKEFKVESKVPPEAELALHHVYGFSSKISQSNVYFVGPDEIIYSAAATVVVHNLATNHQHFLVGHNEDITAIALDASRTYVATGQRDPKGGGQNIPYTCVWEIKTGKLLVKISFHERAVAALCFSPDGKYLVTFGDGELKVGAVWDWRAEIKKKDIARAPLAKFSVAKEKILGTYSAQEVDESIKNGEFHFVSVGEKQTIFWKVSPTLKDKVARSIASTFNATKTIQKYYYCVAHLGAGTIAVGTASGHVYIFKNEKLNKAIAVSSKPVTGIATVPEGFVTASNDGVLRRYNNDCKAIAEFSDFPGGVKPLFQSLDYKDGKLVVGTRDSSIFVLDLDFSKISQPVSGHRDEVCYVAVNGAQPHIASASKDNGIRIWDYSSHTLLHKIALKKAVFSLIYSHDGKTLAYALQDGSVGYVVDGKVTSEAKVGQQQMNGLQFTPTDKELVCGSDDNTLYVLEAATLRLKFKLTGHTSAITHLSISADGKFAATNGRDYAICYWDLVKGKRLTEIGSEVVWEEWTGIYGWPVMGIWDAAGDGSDVNTAIISGKPETWSSPTESKAEVVITGDDLGQVNLYSYPVLAKKNAGVHSYIGHSSHVPCVRLAPGDRFVFSAGGHDLTVFQWKLRKAGQPSESGDEHQNGTKSGDEKHTTSTSAPATESGDVAEAAGDGGEVQAEATEEAPDGGEEVQQEEQPAEDGGEQQAEAEAEELPQE